VDYRQPVRAHDGRWRFGALRSPAPQ